jgi:hypothetical protein
MARARHRLAFVAACLGLTAVAGCAVASSGKPASPVAAAVSPSVSAGAPTPAAPTDTPPASPALSPGPSPAGVNVAAFNALARHEASAWPNSPLGKVWQTGLVIPLADDLSSGPSGGFPSSETKEAFGNGNLVFTGPKPSRVPEGVVTWADGSSVKVPVLSEAQAFSALKNNSGGRCPSCVTTPLAVTAASPTTMPVRTSRGTASVPAWAFTLQGVSTPVLEAALPPGSYVAQYSFRAPMEQLGPVGREFVGAVAATPSADGRTLTLTLDSGACDTTWGGLVAEAGDVVVAGGWMHDPHPDAPCAASLVGRTVTVRLAKPLGDRVVLDAATGWPASQLPLFPPVPK